MKAVEPMPPSNGLNCWREVQSGMKMPLCVEASSPPQVQVVRIADPSLPFGGTWKYELEPAGPAETKLTITEDGTTGPAIWRFLGHYVMKEDTQIKQYESDLLKAVGGHA